MNDGYVDRLRKGASLSSGISPILETVAVAVRRYEGGLL